MQVNTLRYQIAGPVKTEMQKKGRTTESNERLTDGEEECEEEEEDKKKMKN